MQHRNIPVPVRKWAINHGADNVDRFEQKNETTCMGVTVTFKRDKSYRSVRVVPDNAPDGFEIVGVTSRKVESETMKTTVQFRPE